MVRKKVVGGREESEERRWGGHDQARVQERNSRLDYVTCDSQRTDIQRTMRLKTEVRKRGRRILACRVEKCDKV